MAIAAIAMFTKAEMGHPRPRDHRHRATKDGCQNGHAQPLRHGFPQDAEAAVGNRGANEAAETDDQKDDAHEPQRMVDIWC